MKLKKKAKQNMVLSPSIFGQVYVFKRNKNHKAWRKILLNYTTLKWIFCTAKDIVNKVKENHSLWGDIYNLHALPRISIQNKEHL